MKGEKVTEALKIFLERGKEWERKPTSIPGVFIVKFPPFRKSPTRLIVELNPVDESGGTTRRRGLALRSYEELGEFRKLLNDDKLDGLLKGIDETNPQAPQKPKPERKEDIIEI